LNLTIADLINMEELTTRITHKAGDKNCQACRTGYPTSCTCEEGLIHASKGCVVVAMCDKCIGSDKVIGEKNARIS
jgi:hypothetical protein